MKKTYIIAGAGVGILIIVVLTVLLVRSNSQMSEMTEVFTEEREQLVTQYEDLQTEYVDLHSDNDSLENILTSQRARVEMLTQELKTLKASNARRIKELEGELTTLRTVMRSFLVQIDSLNQRNTALTKENTEIKSQLASASRKNESLKEQNATLNEKVTLASRLEAKDIEVVGLNNKERETDRIGKIAKLKVSFTLAKNISAEVGMIDVFLRITRPDGQLLMHSKSDTFKYEDSEINFSAKRAVEYGGEDTESYVVYTVDMGDLMEGTYEAELFAGGERIGSVTFKF